ncbi:MAG: tRNA uridine-5-carboxymethylaminomethyl(34) synthesis GTPase MnmE [Verrucomicrobiota bacterium]
MMPEDTIAAISTALGESALAVIRLSGARAFEVADHLFAPASGSAVKPSQAASHTLHYGHFLRRGKVIDEVMLAILRAPRTFTREDTVEVSCHGGILIAKLVLDACLEQGARLAMPGEFTKRAFLNGRIDLTQAEAVADLIQSRTELALVAANQQLAGKLSQRIHHLRDDLMKALAHIEAHIDFPDEDIAPATVQNLLLSLEQAVAGIGALLATAPEGQLLRRGIRAAIVGRPNVGKSSLLNQLLGHERAIVSAEPGTTRDTIEETANVRGLPVVFVDTAGLRDSADAVEREGVRRSHQTLGRAELVLHVLDQSSPLTAADHDHLKRFADKKRILVLNKSDLPAQVALPVTDVRFIRLSCVTGEGLEALKDAIKDLIWAGEISSEMLDVMINSRHQATLSRAAQALGLAIASLRAGVSLELVAVDLRSAVNAVGEIVGKTSTEDLLDSVFGQFCIGK